MTIEDRIRELAADHAKRLKAQIARRVKEMDEDDSSHFLIYQVLGVSD